LSDKSDKPLDEFNELLKKLGERSPALAASGAALLAGIALLADDAHDFGKLGGDKDHPSPFHHWMWGTLLIIGASAGLGAALLDLLCNMPPPPASERLPPSLIEGAPKEEVEKIEKMLEIK